ncbi:MAG: VWA domain-containing protein [Thermoanaerobaculia bacterium]
MRRVELGGPEIRRSALVAGFALAAALSGSTPSGAQIEPISETVDVRVVNVEVVATDNQGIIIRGLTRDDFELVVDGREIPIEYFSAVEAPLLAESTAQAAADPRAESLPLLIINYDARFLTVGSARDALETLRSHMGELLESTRAIMIARQGMSLVVEQPFTRDRARLEAALSRLIGMNVPVRSTVGRSLVISELERIPDAAMSGFTEEDEGALDIALQLLNQVRTQSAEERGVQRTAIAQLEWLIGSVAGLPGRKALLYVGPGIQPQPAEALYRLWWARFSSLANQLNVLSIESEMGLDIASAQVTDLLARANESQVTFYGYDPRGVRAQSSLEFESFEASEYSERDVRAAQQWILSVAEGSGGAGRIDSADLDGLVTEMTGSFRNYYSLGFSPANGFPDRGKVRVRLANLEGRVRHFDRYLTRSGTRELQELTLAALLTEMVVNSMDVQVEMDDAVPQVDGTFVIPILVKIPIASLSLLPKGQQHVGKLSVVVQAQGSGGEISEPAEGVVAVELDNDDLLKSLGGMAGYRLRMRVSSGEQRIAIGVRDEVAQRDSAVRLVIQAGRDS